MEDLTGKQLGPYQVVAPLGEGGMAAVYKAYQPNMGRYVALKILPRHYASDPQFVARFTQEARVIANLEHPHILPVHDFGESEGYTYLAMRLVEGGSLARLLQGAPLALTQVRQIVSQVGDALDYAHTQGVIHRDVKPSNILIDQRGNCLLSDFGIAKMLAGSSHLTQTGAMLGTPAYMSPEQGMGQSLDGRSDLYSLGIILYQMVTGRIPYQAETPLAVAIKHVNDPLPPVHRFNPAVPVAVEQVILKTLAKNPADRFSSAGEMVRALQLAVDSALAAGLPPTTPPTPPPSPPVVDYEDTEVAAPPLFPAATSPPLTHPPPSPPPTRGRELPSPPEGEGLGERVRSRRPWLLPAVGGLAVVGIVAALLGGLYWAGVFRPGQATPTPAATKTLVVAAAATRTPQPTAAPTLDAAKWDQLLEQADAADAIGDFQRTYEFLSEAIGLNPEDAAVYCWRGDILRELERNDEALADFQQCADKAAVAGNADLEQKGLISLARTQSYMALAAGDDGAADTFLHEWYNLEPDNPEPYCHLGDLYFRLGDWGAAETKYTLCLDRATEPDTRRWAGHSLAYTQAHSARQNENWPVAILAYDEAIRYEPTGAWLYCERGESYQAWSAAGQELVLLPAGPLRPLLRPDTVGQVVKELQQELNLDGAQPFLVVSGIYNPFTRAAVRAFQARYEITPQDGIAGPDTWRKINELGLPGRLTTVEAARQDFLSCLMVGRDDPDTRAWAQERLDELQTP